MFRMGFGLKTVNLGKCYITYDSKCYNVRVKSPILSYFRGNFGKSAFVKLKVPKVYYIL